MSPGRETFLLNWGEGLSRGLAGNGKKLIDLFSSVGGRVRYVFDYRGVDLSIPIGSGRAALLLLRRQVRADE